MLPGAGCSLGIATLDGVLFTRIQLGRESDDWWLGHDPATSCHDCSVVTGQRHHVGCDMEQCPRCGGQLLGCGCTVGSA
jgi:hypothetical protein